MGAVGLTLFVQLDLDQARPIPTMPEIKVTYFNLRVRGEPIRLLLAYGDLPYEDIRPLPPWEDKEGWAKMKPTLPYGLSPSWSGMDRVSTPVWPDADLLPTTLGSWGKPHWSTRRLMRLWM